MQFLHLSILSLPHIKILTLSFKYSQSERMNEKNSGSLKITLPSGITGKLNKTTTGKNYYLNIIHSCHSIFCSFEIDNLISPTDFQLLVIGFNIFNFFHQSGKY